VANATHSVAGYVQDAYFLGGAVSYTTKYIFETYAGQKIENNQNKQYGIMQKQ